MAYNWRKEVDRMTADMTDTANDCFWCSQEARSGVDPESFFNEVMRQFKDKIEELKHQIIEDHYEDEEE